MHGYMVYIGPVIILYGYFVATEELNNLYSSIKCSWMGGACSINRDFE